MAEPLHDYLWDGTGSDPEVERFELLLADLQVDSLPPSLPDRRSPWPAIIVAAALVLLAATVVIALWSTSEPQRLGPEPATRAADRSIDTPSRVTPAPATPAPATPVVAGAALPELTAPQPAWFEAGTTLRAPLLSADGSAIAFSQGAGTAGVLTDVVLGDVFDGGMFWARRLEASEHHGTARHVAGVHWSPRSGAPRYLYVSKDAAGSMALHTSGGLVLEPSITGPPAWDPTGEQLVVPDRRGLMLRGISQGAPSTPLTAPGERPSEPAFLADSSGVVFIETGATDVGVHLVDLTRMTTHPLTTFPGGELSAPTPSPDSRTVAFLRRTQPGSSNWSLWTIGRAVGEPPTYLGDGFTRPTLGSLPWTPDGQALLMRWTPDRGDPCIARVALDGTAPRCLALGTTGSRDPDIVATDEGWRLAWAADAPDGSAPGGALFIHTVEPF